MIKNMNESTKKIIAYVITTLLIILSTLAIIEATVEANTYTYVGEDGKVHGVTIIHSEHLHNYNHEGDYLPAEHLYNYYDVYCCQRGTALKSLAAAGILHGSSGDTISSEKDTLAYLLPKDKGMTILHQSTEHPSDIYVSNTIGYYKLEFERECTPKEAYVLSEMIKTDGMGYFNYVQIAWWTTPAGHTGGDAGKNAFTYEAEAFEAYILEVAGVSSTSELKYKTAKFFDDEAGVDREYEHAFDFEYKPEWVLEGEYATPTVRWDSSSEKYIVGPFAIDYIGSTVEYKNEDGSAYDPGSMHTEDDPIELPEGVTAEYTTEQQFGDREPVEFAGIRDMKIFTDVGELEFGTDWEFVWVDGERSEHTDSKYPLGNEKFYIRLVDKENLTKITNIKTYFRYMNAAGIFDRLKGYYFDCTWEQRSKKIDDENSEYYLKLVTVTPQNSQNMALGLSAARWYEYMELDRQFDIRSGKVRITKLVVDGDDEPINDIDKYFIMKLNVSGADNSDGPEYIKVKANSVATSKVYYWMASNGTPTYTIEELPDDEYKLVSIEPASGSLDENKPINVIVKNRKESTGRIEIVKKIEPTTVGGVPSNLDGKTFEFPVKITGTFKYEGQTYKNQTCTVIATVTISGGEGRWTSGDIKWYGDNAPTYVIEENPNEDADLVSIIPSSGTVMADTVSTVTATNKQKTEKARIHVIKTLENADKYDEEEIMNLHFNFKIKVDGYKEIYAVTNAKIENNTYIWEYTTGYFVWQKGHNPNYTITEVDNPEGTEFVSASNENGTGAVSGSTISGTLTQDSDFMIDNNIVNKITRDHHGKIKLVKTIEDAERLKDKDYKFCVAVTGTFDYKGTTYKNATIQLHTDGTATIINPEQPDYNNLIVIHIGTTDLSNTWESDDFTWYGNTAAPTFTVAEDVIGEDVAASVEPSSGTLKAAPNDDGLITVQAYNKDNFKEPEAGYIHIIKTLENADKVTEEYVKSLVFEFRIEVEGYEAYNVQLQPEKIGNSYVWEYKSDKFEWEKGKEPLHYSIEEINVPEGTEFVSANGGTSTKVEGQLLPNGESEHVIYTDNEFINKATEKEGNLEIIKEVQDDCLQGKEFKFKVSIKGTFEYKGVQYKDQEYTEEVTVAGGSSTTIGPVKWCGDSAPTYTVEELESDIAELVSVQGGSGTLKEGSVCKAIFTNKVKEIGGYLSITKKIDGNVQTDDTFKFEVKIGDKAPYYVSIKANETYTSDYIKWPITDPAPEYSVTEVELPEGATLVRIDGGNGNLLANETVKVVAYNKYEEHSGSFSVKKEIIADEKLLDGIEIPTFTMKATISGTFELNGESVVDSTRVLEFSLSKDQVFTSPTIKWWGGNAPSVTVVETNVPTGWECINISNNGSSLSSDVKIEIVVTNRLKTQTIIDLTMKLAGNVWVDVPQGSGKNTPDSVPDGIMQDNEKRVQGVLVYVYDGQGNLAQLYDDGLAVSQTTLPVKTDANGYWEVPSIKVQKLSGYDVEFVYDGQTYEPTKFLATSNGNAEAYRSASTAERDKWERDSKALDYDRAEVNGRIGTIYGDTDISGTGLTLGKVDGNSGEQSLTYHATNIGQNNDASITNSKRLISKLVTTNEDGTALDLFKAKARTSSGGLTYPFDKQVHLESVDTYISELGLVQAYKYSATYNYMLNVNLGLVEREAADTGITKDLNSAKVIVNNRLMNYKFNRLDSYGKDLISRQLAADTQDITYQLGFYQTDYYYRAELYQQDRDVYTNLETFYNTLSTNPESTELEVYLNYKISLYNESPSMIVEYKQIVDYFDATFEAPVDTEVRKYVKTVDGKDQEGTVVVATPSSMNVNGSTSPVTWEVVEKGIKGSDGITYNKMVANFDGLKLQSGEYADIMVTFKVHKDNYNGNQNAVPLGDKSNVVEVAKYTTYNADGTLAGKVDRDSAADNANILSYNNRAWYEDDTDQAPVLKLTLLNERRTVSGKAFEDNADDGEVGVYDDGAEALIGGLTTELVEKVKLKGDSNYVEYDYLWPTNIPMDQLGGKTIEYVSGFDSTTETSRENVTDGLSVGEYEFKGVPTGNYVVRFLYGNDKLELRDTYANTSDPVALKADGTQFSDNENILTANYKHDNEGYTAAVYNGQDYKSTVYQKGFVAGDAAMLTNEWHDLNNESLVAAKVNDARDNEAQRLDVIAESETVINANDSIMHTANDSTVTHTKLYRNYGMYSDTAKLNMTLLGNAVGAEEVTGTILEGQSVVVEEVAKQYDVKGIDLGLVERPENRITLDKQISEIKITTNNEQVIFDAIYNIEYKKAGLLTNLSDKTVVGRAANGDVIYAEITLNPASKMTEVMQALNKSENKLTNTDTTGLQNFRFINVDSEILQGTNIDVEYLFTAINLGETDYTSETLANMKETAKANNTTVKEEIRKLADQAREEASIAAGPDSVVRVGSYVGSYYYTGNVLNDKVVTTEIRQLVDYVDNDYVFTENMNIDPNHSWRVAALNELTGNGFEDQRLIDLSVIPEYESVDPHGMTFYAELKHNVVLSVDDKEDKLSGTNKDFEVELVPYEDIDNPGYMAQIKLTASKHVSAEDDANNLSFDNLAEIVKLENTVGRRDMATLSGNANPKFGEFVVSLAERDQSATELITFTPPTGIDARTPLTMQVLIIVLISLVILTAGVVVIKKFVLK